VVPYNEFGDGVKSASQAVTLPSADSYVQAPQETDGSSNIGSLGIILGVVIGVVGIFVVVVLVVFFVRQRRNHALGNKARKLGGMFGCGMDCLVTLLCDIVSLGL
jgi:heme/copper-type cytochrome/quinol oxidase subunit 2